MLWFGLSNSSLVMPNPKKIALNYLVHGCTQDKCTLHHPKLTYFSKLTKKKKVQNKHNTFFLSTQAYDLDLQHRFMISID